MMMKKKNAVALGVAALVGTLGLINSASAGVIVAAGGAANGGGRTSNAADLRVNEGGIGHSLLIPYFTTQNGNATLINIVNTDTVNGKAVKVRFRGASNSDDIFDFQLFLSPGDVWTANISAGANGVSQLLTNDNSCTLPSLKGVPNPFVLDRLPPESAVANRPAQTREGYVEIFNMADIPMRGVNLDATTGNNRLFTAIKHVNGVPPCTFSVFNTLATDPVTEQQANSVGLTAPTTGLFANTIIINQNTAVASWSYEATAILAVGFVNTSTGSSGEAAGNIVFFPQTSDPLANPNQVTADPLLRIGTGTSTGVQNGSGGSVTVSTPAIAAANFDAPDMSTPYLAFAGSVTSEAAPLRQAQELSQSIATRSIRNEYLTASNISAATDWTFSQPTRRYSVALDYRTNPGTPVYSNLVAATGGGANYYTSANTRVVNNQICLSPRGTGSSTLASTITAYDQEETLGQQSGFVISPGNQLTISFCGEASVLSFNQGASAQSAVLSASIARNNLSVPFSQGWAAIDTSGVPGQTSLNNDGTTGAAGLPILGRYYLVATNPAVRAGFSGNFGASFSHRYDRPASGVRAQPGAAL